VGSVQHVFLHVDKDLAIISTTDRLPDVNPPCLYKCSRDQLNVLTKQRGTRDNLVTHPTIDLCDLLARLLFEDFIIVIIIISLLMSPLLGHRPALWITHRRTGRYPPCGLVGANDCKCNRDQRPSEAGTNVDELPRSHAEAR
jgi:hypothetical protein